MTDPCPTSAPNEPNIRFLARATQLLPGVLLAVVVGQAASVVAQAVGLRAGGLALAIGAGVGLANSPFGRWLKGSYFEDGLRFVTARLLKVAVVMSGLKVQIALFDTSWLVESLAILVVTIPTSFVVAHFMAARLRLRSEVGDLIAIGTMICGASAINALVPVIGAKRSEQGLAITAVSTFSIFAMFVFLPIGKWLQLSDAAFGGWSGLAVGDFSSAVGVGAQFSDAASVIATASKSLRVLLLGPVIVLFSSVRCARRDGASSPPLGWGAMGRHVPGFVAVEERFGRLVPRDLQHGDGG